jgi:hypothetical protein
LKFFNSFLALEILDLSVSFSLVDGFEFEGGVQVACTLEELVLEFNPVKSQSVEEAFEDIHHH